MALSEQARELTGLDLIIYTANHVRIAGQRNATINLAGDTIDTTSKDNDGWKSTLTGLLSWTCNLDVVEFAGQSGKEQAIFQKHMINREPVTIVAVLKGKYVFEGLATITSKDTAGAYADVATGAYQLNGAGKPTISFVPFIESATGTGTTVTITLTEKATEVEADVTLKERIKINDVNPSDAQLAEGVITCTVTSVADKQSVYIQRDTIKNGKAIQAYDLIDVVTVAGA